MNFQTATEMENTNKCFVETQKNLIICSKLKNQSLFVELTNVYNHNKKDKKIPQLENLKKYVDSIKNKEILVGLGFIYGNKDIIKEDFVDFCFHIRYEEKILSFVLGELNGSMPMLKKKEPLKGHHDRLYFDQQTVLDGLIYLNEKGNETLIKLLDPRYKFKKNLFEKLYDYINNKRGECNIQELSKEDIVNNIGIIQGVTLEDYIFRIFNQDMDNDIFTYKRHGYNTNELIDNNENTTREIDIIITGDKLKPSLKHITEINLMEFYPKKFYEQFTS